VGDGRIVMERDGEAGIARLTIDNPVRRNAYDPPMREALGRHLDDIALDDDIKVVLLRGEGGVFSTGADMGNAYSWYGDGTSGPTRTADSGARSGRSAGAGDDGPAEPRTESSAAGGDAERATAVGAEPASDSEPGERRRSRRPSQRRRLSVDRKTFGFYHEFLGYPKVTVAEVGGYALGGGFELALMADISVVAADTRVGMPATRMLGPALGSLHMFFYRLGPVLARRLLLTGDTVAAADLAHLSVFTEVVEPGKVAARADWFARKCARMPADGIVIAKEAFRLVEQMQGYQGEEAASYLFHAFGTNLQFDEGEFNFVKARAEHGTRQAFELRDAHFDVPEP
jgi:enoyl-CoA hydratase/carnithine racemase